MRGLSIDMGMRGAALMILNASTPTILTKLTLFSRPHLKKDLHHSSYQKSKQKSQKNTPIKSNLECKIMMVDKRSDKGSATATSAMAGEDGSPTNTMRTAETLLRLLPIAPCLAALVVMLHDSQTNDFGSISYSHLGSFRYLVHANAICAGYSLLSAIISAMRRPFFMSQAWTFFFLDQVVTYLVLSAGAVSTEVLYLAYKGDLAITWTAACESFGKFCHKGSASVAMTFLVVVCYALLSLISSYRLFSKYEAPVCKPTKGIEAATFHG